MSEQSGRDGDDGHDGGHDGGGHGDRSGGERDGKESLRTVLVAAGANLLVAVAKLLAGLLSNSAAMLSEAAHSAADTITELLLLVAVRRGGAPADETHPFGYGKAAFFWALMAAGATLVGGAGFSVTHGVQTIVQGEELADLRVSFVVLAVAFVLEGVSFVRAVRQVRREAGRRRLAPGRFFAATSDTALKAVVFEDSAALVGILIAAGGLLGVHLTGRAVFDGVASVLIGLLLLAIALRLIQVNASLLIGQAAPPRIRGQIQEELLAFPEVVSVVELLTMMLGPDALLVAAKVDFADDATGGGLEQAADRVEKRLKERFPGVTQVFLDPTPGRVRPGGGGSDD
jgi:cation diffusion facilitator family transporter